MIYTVYYNVKHYYNTMQILYSTIEYSRIE